MSTGAGPRSCTLISALVMTGCVTWAGLLTAKLGVFRNKEIGGAKVVGC